MTYVQLADLLYNFRAKHLILGQPDHARDKCDLISVEFRQYAEERGHAARLVKGFVTTTWNGRIVVLQGHVAVELNGNTVVDWTARQFGINEDFPRVVDTKVWTADWPPLPKSAEPHQPRHLRQPATRGETA